jgi:hypothetical protein
MAKEKENIFESGGMKLIVVYGRANSVLPDSTLEVKVKGHKNLINELNDAICSIISNYKG